MKKVPLSCKNCGNRNYNVPKKEGSATRLTLRKCCPRCNAYIAHEESK